MGDAGSRIWQWCHALPPFDTYESAPQPHHTLLLLSSTTTDTRTHVYIDSVLALYLPGMVLHKACEEAKEGRRVPLTNLLDDLKLAPLVGPNHRCRPS